MKKFKLIIASIHIKNSPQAMPLAGGLLKSMLDSIPEIKNRINTSFTDFYLGMKAESIAEGLCSEHPEIIGFSTYLWNIQIVEEISHIIKNRFPGIILFAGGAEATANPHDLLKKAPFDFVIKGEGELVLLEVIRNFIDNKPYQHIAGVCAGNEADDSEENQWPVADIDSLPSPFLNRVIDLKKYNGVLWELSRGCPFKCSFCFESKGIAGVRQFSLERIRKELDLFESKKVNQIFVLDPTFNRDVKRAKTILRMIQKTAPLIHFTFEVRAEFIDNEMAKLFSMINCSLQIGLQSSLPGVLENVNRKIDPDKFARKISLLNSAGVIFGLDLIYGLPGDTLAGFKQSLDYALNLQPNHLDIFPLAVLPGTALHDQAESFKLNRKEEAPYTVISTPDFSSDDITRAEALKDACDIFYNLGGAAGWMFMILETFDIQPSDFLDDFAKYLLSNNQSNNHTRDNVFITQSSFVKEIFKKNKRTDLFPVMDDIIRFHGALNRSLYAGPHPSRDKTRFNDETGLKLSAGTTLIALNYSFDDLMSVGELTLDEFIARCRPHKTYVIVYNCEGDVKPLIVPDYLFRMLNSLSPKQSLKDIIKNNPSVKKKEINEFIEHAISETIIHTV